MKKSENKNKQGELIPFIVIIFSTISLGILTLLLLQKFSTNNKYICSYLGGLWMKKDLDQVHRCYTYEEYYK